MTKPMLAVEAVLPQLRYPLLASPKLDGIRYLGINGEARTRSLKLFPNAHVQACLHHEMFNGLDGELIVGDPTAKDCMQQCTSHLMSKDKVFKFTLHVFDRHDMAHPFDVRFKAIQNIEEALTPHITKHKLLGEWFDVKLVDQSLITSEGDLLAFEQKQLDLGYEGLILRDPKGAYKYGRSTMKEQFLIKMKRFKDSEAEIIGFEEQMFNGNEAMTNELGRTKRSTAKAGLVGKGTLGAFLMRDIHTGVEFSCGTGMDDRFRAEVWANRPKYLGRIGKYKFFPVGVKDAPRHPVWLGFRDARDL